MHTRSILVIPACNIIQPKYDVTCMTFCIVHVQTINVTRKGVNVPVTGTYAHVDVIIQKGFHVV